jgi:hypothetical protein
MRIEINKKDKANLKAKKDSDSHSFTHFRREIVPVTILSYFGLIEEIFSDNFSTNIRINL